MDAVRIAADCADVRPAGAPVKAAGRTRIRPSRHGVLEAPVSAPARAARGHRPAPPGRDAGTRARVTVRPPGRRANLRGRCFAPSGQSPSGAACGNGALPRISLVQRPKLTRRRLLLRVAAPTALAWACAGAGAAPAAADACAWARTGPDGAAAVSVAGSGRWPSLPPCGEATPTPRPPSPTPTPAPTPPPVPTPTPTPTPEPPAPPPPPPSPSPRPTARPEPPEPRPTPTPVRPRPAPPARVTAAAPPAPEPPAEPAPSPTPRPGPSVRPVAYPRHHAAPHRRAPHRALSPVTYVLLVAVPALAAVAALRPR